MPLDEICPGTLYLPKLRTLARFCERHGHEIANSIQRIPDDVLQVEEASLVEMSQFERVIGAITRLIRTV